MNQTDLLDWSTIVANIVTSLGILGFVWIYLAHRQSVNQFKFTVMLSCIERFQKLSPLLKGDGNNLSPLKNYVDLTNEEFFYFQQEYIPKEVIVEWMDSIVGYFPIYVKGSDHPINYDQLPFRQIHDERLLRDYPRLIRAFTLHPGVNYSDKVNLIKHIGKNLKISLRDKHFRRAQLLPD